MEMRTNERTKMQALLTLMGFIRPSNFWDEACKVLKICK